MALKDDMHPSARASVENQLVALEQRLQEANGELAVQAEAIAACAERGQPAGARLRAEHARQREAFWSIKRRCEELRSRLVAPPPGTDDF